MTTSAAEMPVSCISTGIPRPLSSTMMLLSTRILTVILSQYPAAASSMLLSTTS
ncbi:MAG: hypothetical protein A4E72_00257 [Syntrophus sp. PtaU1.Bin208]|nr:MAG: hypothetical protein A4E72_00257 [Syntrophus sp. PtaU1.Bin208]